MFLHLSVILSTRGCLSHCMLGYTPTQADTHPWADTPHADTPSGQTPPRQRSPGILRDMIKKWAVHILLECILVLHHFSNQKIWLGLTDTAVESVFQWFDGSVTTWVNWTPGEPDGSVSANCVVRQKYGKWLDEGCESQFHFYCEEG